MSMRHRVEVFVGPFGSGKTEVAVNRGLLLAAEGTPVTLADLDLVDPFFRARQVRTHLARAGVRVVAPEGEWQDADLPLLISEVFRALQRPGHVLVDVGGEVQGAIVLCQIRSLLPEEAGVYLVVNPYRPMMSTPEQIAEVSRALEVAAGVKVTALVSVPHLGEETTLEVIQRGHAVVEGAAALLTVPVSWLGVRWTLASALESAIEILPLRLHMRAPWDEDGLIVEASEGALPGGTRG
jgi:RecA/RadA recombinase